MKAATLARMLTLGLLVATGCSGGGGGSTTTGALPETSPNGSGGTTTTTPGTGGTATTPVPGTGGTAGMGVSATTGGTSGGGTAGTVATVAPPAAPAVASTGTIVPLYTPPTDPSWDLVAAAKRQHPTVPVYAVINPANGPGGGVDANYAAGISKLTDAGVKVLGYVRTGYASRAQSDVKVDVDHWHGWYPQVQGIFFDEESYRDGNDSYYRALTAYAKLNGLSFTVGNPGVDSAPSFVGACDVTLIYESRGLPSLDKLQGWHSNYARTYFGIIPYGTQLDDTFVRNAKAYVGYIYVNADLLPNPWDSVASYFPQLLADLEG
jgi:hypothetical protein